MVIDLTNEEVMKKLCNELGIDFEDCKEFVKNLIQKYDLASEKEVG